MRVFISYKREDEAFARRLYAEIVAWGYSPWLDVLDIPAGQGWDTAIHNGLRRADVVLGLLTPDSLNSPNVLDEWGYALTTGKRLLLLWLRPVAEADIPPRYIRIQRISFMQGEARGLNLLRAALGTPAIADADAPTPVESVGLLRSPLNLSGQTLRGVYEIREKIGSGGYGAVYRAHQAGINREVAIKVILPEHANAPKFLNNFEREARLVARLEHPRIVPLFDYWQDDMGAFLVMRWLRGGSLRDRVRLRGPLEPAQVAHILDQVAEALTVAHNAGVVHRDLKPDNILLDELGNAYLTDFGIAKNLEQVTSHSTDAMVGTPDYLSPEQIQRLPVTPHSDLYSLGIVLYELLTGDRPFADAGLMVLMKHLRDPLPSLHSVNPALPPALDAVIQRATAKDPAQRYPDAAALARAFREAVGVMTPVAAIAPAPADAPPPPSVMTPATDLDTGDRNRHNMLQNVRTFWIRGVLENSLHGAAFIALGLRQRTGEVDNPWEVVLRQPGAPDAALPARISMHDVFEQLNGKLLILGEPGSGKTSSMLDLARDLLARAARDEGHPMPVVFNLSSWAETRKPMVEWLVDELSGKYHVPRAVAQGWVDADALLLLLDGLDEVSAEHRDACVRAINDYRAEHGFVDMVVCSRIADYEDLEDRLRLNGAVVLQPLNDAQIDHYLDRLGPEMSALRAMLGADERLRELARSPLILSIMVLAYEGVSSEDLPRLDTPEAQRAHLFNVYVRRMFERRGRDVAYTPARTAHYLSWLAQRMAEHGQSVFHIENMQPTWLPEARRTAFFAITRGIYTALYMLVMAVVVSVGVHFLNFAPLTHLLAPPAGLLIGFITARVSADSRLRASPLGLALIGGACGLTMAVGAALSGYDPARVIVGGLGIAGVVAFLFRVGVAFIREVGTVAEQITMVEQVRITLQRVSLALIAASFIGGVLLVLFMAFLFGGVVDPGALLLSAITGGLLWVTGIFMLQGLTVGDVSMRTEPNQGVRSSLRNANRVNAVTLIVILLFGPLALAPITSFGFGMAIAAMAAALFNVGIWFGSGGATTVQHTVLRRMLEAEGAVPRDYAHFLDHCTALILLRKVGGGYIFIHRYLLEYFAALEPTEPPQP